jgi:hypothetical protein
MPAQIAAVQMQTKKNKPMAPTILERGLPICGLRPNHVCEVGEDEMLTRLPSHKQCK